MSGRPATERAHDQAARRRPYRMASKKHAGGRAGDVEQGEGHQGVGVQRAEAQGPQAAGEGGHARIGGDAGDTEEHRAAGDHHLFGGDAGDEGHHDLPVAQADGGEEGHNPLAQDGAEGVGHVGGVAGGAEV